MLKIIDENSPKSILPELDLRAMPGSQVGVQNTKWTKINLKNSITHGSTGPFEFQLAYNSKNYVNLKRSWIVWKLKILGADGKPVPAKHFNDLLMDE